MSSQPSRNQWLMFICMGLMILMISIEYSAVNLAIPTMKHIFNISISEATWILNAYILTWIIFMVPAGRLADHFGRLKMFYIGATIFIAASCFCAISTDASTLISMRLLQGLGTAIIFPCCTSLMFMAFSPKSRKTPVAISITLASLGMALGPVISGALISHLNWRWVFFINAPICAVVVLLSLIFLRIKEEPSKKSKLDIPGLCLFTLFISTLMLIFTNGLSWGINSWKFQLCFLTSFFSLIALIYVERRHSNPIFPKIVLTNRTFIYSAAARLLINSCAGVLLFLLPLLMINFYKFSPQSAGLLLLPYTIALGAASVLTILLFERYNERTVMVLGLGLISFGLICMAYFHAESDIPKLMLFLSIMGAGVGLSAPAATAIVMHSAPQKEAGLYSATYYVISMAGNTVGSVVSGMIIYFFDHIHSLSKTIASHPASIYNLLSTHSSLIHHTVPSILTAFPLLELSHILEPSSNNLLALFSDSFFWTMMLFAIAAIFGMVISSQIKQIKSNSPDKKLKSL